MRKFVKQLGQGMTEYIIIVALIAIAAIAVYGFFGDTIRAQMGSMSMELSGQTGSKSKVQAAGKAAEEKGTKKGTLGDYQGQATK